MLAHKFEERDAVVIENDGQKIFGIIHRPLNIEKSPAILVCHGLGGQKAGRNRTYVELAQALAKNGITVLRIDFRGSGDSEGNTADITVESKVSDAQKALDFLQQDQRVDASKIGLFGRSLGGAVAVITAQRRQTVKSLVLWAPVFNGDQWRNDWIALTKGHINPEKTSHLTTIRGQHYGMPFFHELFSLKLENDMHIIENVPFLVIHGEQDKEVHASHSERYDELRKQAAHSKFIRLPQGDHGFSRKEDQTYAIEQTIQWFKRTLT